MDCHEQNKNSTYQPTADYLFSISSMKSNTLIQAEAKNIFINILKTTRWWHLLVNPILQKRYPIMVKCLNYRKNICKTIYRSISTLEQSRPCTQTSATTSIFYSHSQKSSQSRALSTGTISDVSVRWLAKRTRNTGYPTFLKSHVDIYSMNMENSDNSIQLNFRVPPAGVNATRKTARGRNWFSKNYPAG